jgi:hypothetical protein
MIYTEPKLDTAEDLLAALLVGTVGALDIPFEMASEAYRQYQAVGAFLNEHGDAIGGAPWDIYAQGSFRLGTVVSPAAESGHYDIDLVCLRSVEKTSTTQRLLKGELGTALKAYVRGSTEITTAEAGRCWTLDYRNQAFHMDVLPAIPDSEGSPTGILITDRVQFQWLKSDPKAYADWFSAQQTQELLRKREALADQRQSTTESVPIWQVKTTLQQGVQVFKRHRDLFFVKDPRSAPPSILITTLAALAYRGEQNLYEAVAMMAEEMPTHVARDGLTWYVPNPAQPEENFADKWRSDPSRRLHFFRWIEAVKADLQEARRSTGLEVVTESLSRSFGETVVRKSAAGLGDLFRTKRESGDLAMAAGTGTLGSLASNARPVRRHGFYGGPGPK